MVEPKTWQEFRDNGLFWWINMMLHTFGWAIVVEIEEDGNISKAYPARVKFRGFSEANNTEGYKKISKFLVENAKDLEIEASE